MGLTGLDIYKKLPKTNCGDCGVPTCLAFAMKLATGAASLDLCPHVSEEAKAELSEASAPPMRLVTIGRGDNALKVGEELVLFRHEKTFYRPCGYALLLDDAMDAATVDRKLKEAVDSQWDRVGQLLRSDAVAVKCSSGDAGKFASLAERAKGPGFPLILVSDKPQAMAAALERVGSDRPLIHAATDADWEAMAELAKKHDCPLAVRAETLEALSDLSEKVSGAGVKDLVLDVGSRSIAQTFERLVMTRRSAVGKKFKPFGYPTIVFPAEETSDELMEAVHGAVYTLKYGSIIVLSGLESWKMLPLFTLRQNIYTDPQRPMQVQEGVYPIGNPTEDSPVLLTTNFSLTYFIVSSEIESSRVPAWLCIMEAEGLSVLTAWAAGKFVPEKIAPFIKRCGIADKVKHRTLIIPGYVAQISGELDDELDDWRVQVGVREAGDIGGFLRSWSPAEVAVS